MSGFQTLESCMEDILDFKEFLGDEAKMLVNRPDHLHLQPAMARSGSTNGDGRLMPMTELVRENLQDTHKEMHIAETQYRMNPPRYFGSVVVDHIDELNEMLRATMRDGDEQQSKEGAQPEGGLTKDGKDGTAAAAEGEGEGGTIPDRSVSPKPDSQTFSCLKLDLPKRDASRCQYCSCVGESLALWCQAHRNKSFEPRLATNSFSQWSTSLLSLMAGTNDRCCFCSFICDQFFGPGGWTVAWLYEPKKEWYADPKEEKIRNKLLARCMTIYESYGGDIDLPFSVIPRSASEDNPADIDRLEIGLPSYTTQDWERLKKFVHVIVVKLSVYAARGSETADLISTRPPNANPASRWGLGQLKQWLQECDCSHQDTCKSTLEQTEAKLPSRVIDVQGGERLQLYETTENDKGSYVALSYCWGGPQEFRTTTSTLADRVAGFRLNELPPTLRDAVLVVQDLGLRYLWVDSLCIVQDDENDKVHEVSKMGEIYQSAYLTISAARADKTTEGFLRDTNDPETGLWKNLFPLSLPIPNHNAASPDELWDEDAQNGTLWLSNEVIELKSAFPDPTSRRAWCLQERVLSTRTIVYGRWPIWICNKTAHGDGGPNLLSSQFLASEADRTLSRMIAKSRHDTQPTTTPRLGKTDRALDRMISRLRTQDQTKAETGGVTAKAKITNSDRLSLLYSWYGILDDFTKREMSLESDRLPAIGGVAAEISKLTGDIYVAGLWLGSMLPGLMWSSRTRDWECRPTSGWRAPTWSWASVNGPVSMPAFIFSTDKSTRAEAQCLEMHILNDETDKLFETVSQECELHMIGHISRISDVHAHEIFEIQNMAPSPPTHHFNDWAIKSLAENQERLHKTRKNHAPGTPLPGPIHALITFSHRLAKVVPQGLAEVSCFSGLLLSQISDGQFERIGTFDCLEREWLDDCLQNWERRRVVLV